MRSSASFSRGCASAMQLRTLLRRSRSGARLLLLLLLLLLHLLRLLLRLLLPMLLLAALAATTRMTATRAA